MSKYIEIDTALLKTVATGGISAKALWKRIMQQPSIDIVHCGECKCCRDELIEEHMPLYIYCEKWNHETDFDSFCSAGERIEE